MLQILQPDGSDDPRSTDEQFLHLLLAEEDLLRSEFEAIVAAEWPGSPREVGREVGPQRRTARAPATPDPGATWRGLLRPGRAGRLEPGRSQESPHRSPPPRACN